MDPGNWLPEYGESPRTATPWISPPCLQNFEGSMGSMGSMKRRHDACSTVRRNPVYQQFARMRVAARSDGRDRRRLTRAPIGHLAFPG
jgi:hypothetical protein